MDLRSYFITLTCLCLVGTSLGLDDGIYLLKEGPAESSVRLPGGTAGSIDRKLEQSEYTLSLVSQNNWNDRFSVTLDHKLPPTPTNVRYLAIALDGTLYSKVGTLSDSIESLTKLPVSQQVDSTLAKRIGGIKGGALTLRKHIGQRLSLRFTTERRSHGDGDPIRVSVQVKNLGDEPITVGVEYQTGEQRSSQILIVPSEESEPNCTDVRSRTTKSSSVGRETIAPGGVTTIRQEVLQRWYQIENSGHYHFIGAYKLRIYEHERDKYPCWIEHLASDFEFKYGGK